MTVIANVEQVALTNICALSLKLAANAHWEILKAIIERYKIALVNANIHQKMKVAQLLPFTDDPETQDALVRSIQ